MFYYELIYLMQLYVVLVYRSMITNWTWGATSIIHCKCKCDGSDEVILMWGSGLKILFYGIQFWWLYNLHVIFSFLFQFQCSMLVLSLSNTRQHRSKLVVVAGPSCETFVRLQATGCKCKKSFKDDFIVKFPVRLWDWGEQFAQECITKHWLMCDTVTEIVDGL